MVDFRPFRGWRYNPGVVGDLASVVCPPYDLITPELQESLRLLSPYNVVHLEAGEGLDWNSPAADQYRSTAAVFDEWQVENVLQRDETPSFYLMRHTFEFQGQQMTRLGLTGCVRLEDYEAGQVYPHEYTEEPAVLDRVSLMRQCNTNFSPIMSLYRDPEGALDPLLRDAMDGTPAIDVMADGEQGLTVWRISDENARNQVLAFFSRTQVFLADGHHRYEAALRFRGDKEDDEPDQSAAHNFVMMTLIEFSDPGLLVLPYHRVVSGLDEEVLGRLLERLGQVFASGALDLPKDGMAGALVDTVGSYGQEDKVSRPNCRRRSVPSTTPVTSRGGMAGVGTSDGVGGVDTRRAGFEAGTGGITSPTRRLHPRPRRSRGAGRRRYLPDGFLAQAVPAGAVRGNRAAGTASPPQIDFFLSQAADRFGHQPA